MSTGLNGVLQTALTTKGISQTTMQVRGVYLVATSAEFQIER
jgi:hypothetical protein